MRIPLFLLSFMGIVIGALLVLSSFPKSGIDIRYGLAEASFRLAWDSRLPRWVRLPPGGERSDVLVEFVYFTRSAKVVATNRRTGRTLVAYHSASLRRHPVTEERLKAVSRGYPCPSYDIVSVDGIEEVVEHVERGNVVRVVENSEVTSSVFEDAEKRRRCDIIVTE